MIEQTMFFIKPTSRHDAAAIMDIITDHHLTISNTRKVAVTPGMINILYPGLSDVQMALAREHLIGKVGIVAIVAGENAIGKLVEITGTSLKPPNCRPGTIRQIFGDMRNLGTDKYPFYLNAIHRPRNEAEVVRDLKLFGLN